MSVPRGLAVMLLLVGAGLLAYSASLNAYSNGTLFHLLIAQMTSADAEQFYTLRAQMLTPKYALQDYGITAMLLALVFLFASRTKRLTTPASKRGLVLLALLAPAVLAASFIFDLIQGAQRLEFPIWLDSLGIPLAGVSVLLLAGWLWAGLHLLFIRKVVVQALPLRLAWSRQANLWLLFLSLLMAVAGLAALAQGIYWFALSSVPWLYFYLSLAALRRHQLSSVNDEQ